MLAKPLDEIVDYMVSPHPSREAVECSLRLLYWTRTSANITINNFGVGPVSFYGYDIEAVLFNEMLSDFGARVVEFMRPMGAAADQDNFVVPKIVKFGSKGRIIQRGELGNVRLQKTLAAL